MKVLKGLVLSLLSLLLFLSLSVFGIVFALNSTLLNPDFVVDEVDKLDISSVAGELLTEQLSEYLPEETRFLEGVIKGAITEVVAAQEPWIKEQVNAAVYSSYDYLLGKTERLVVTVSIEPLKENLAEYLRVALKPALTELLPAELAQAPPALIDQYYDEFYQQFADNIPDTFEVDESYLPPEVMETLIQVRQYISYFQTGYYRLIGLMVLLVLLIILINRNVRSATRELGITFLIYGALEFAGVYLARNFMPANLYLPSGLPSSLQSWLLELSGDLLVPLQTFSVGVLVGGVVLLVISFVYPRRAVGE